MRKTKKNSKRTKAEEHPREKATSHKKERRGKKIKRTQFLFYFILFFYFQLQSTYLQYLLTYKQYMVLTLLTKLYSTYKTILIYNVRYLRY